MKTENKNIKIYSHNRQGIILLITLILLVIMSTLGYTLSSRVLARRYRNQYIIDYSKARYGCDSAIKYIMANLEIIEPQLISRPNEPDFSDLYALDENGYKQLLQQWLPSSAQSESGKKKSPDSNEINSIVVRGPYGPVWPLITEPMEFKIDSTNIRIEIMDENAKYPLGWVLINDKQLEREIQAGYLTFCEMMGMTSEQIQSLKEQTARVGSIKPFKAEFKPITTTTTVNTPITRTTGGSTTKTTTSQVKRTVQPVSTQIIEQATHFSRLFHSNLLDIESLSRPIRVSGNRQESPLKYLGVWGSYQVNINTAPRAVLEAALMFGGNEVKIAEEIIQKRRIEPFESTADLKQKLPKYSDSIEKSEQFITTNSILFTIKITAASGVAQATSIVAVIKTGKDVKKIAVINS
jgi:hypothetical protein